MTDPDQSDTIRNLQFQVDTLADHRGQMRKALNEIVRGKGRFFDPEVVKACLAVFKGNRYGFEAEEECRPRGAGAMMC